MSTLSEIAANHAQTVAAREVEGTRLSGPCVPAVQVFDASSLLNNQLPAHTIAAITGALSASAQSASLSI